MIIKLLIIIGIIVAGTLILYPQNQAFFSNNIDETKEEISSFKDNTVKNIEETFDVVIDEISTRFDTTTNGIFLKLN